MIWRESVHFAVGRAIFCGSVSSGQQVEGREVYAAAFETTFSHRIVSLTFGKAECVNLTVRRLDRYTSCELFEQL